MPHFTRRSLLARGTSFALLTCIAAGAPHVSLAQPAMAIHVLKDPNCGCCEAWTAILQAEGFAVTTEARSGLSLSRHKLNSGIPQEMFSCHTGEIEGYFIEGHVPPADIRRLLSERPDAVGLAVPGMPFGSPGMGPEDQREAYDVFLIQRDGSSEVFACYESSRN